MSLAAVRVGAQSLLDLLLPPRCLACGVELTSDAGLCPACWAKIRFIAAPTCVCCGLPFELPDAAGLCPHCLAHPPAFDRARAALIYDEASRGPLLRFKHAGRSGSAKILAGWIAAAAAPLLSDADVIVPVPLHRWRLLKRGYNQAALLAQRLSALADRPIHPDALVRRKATAGQGHLGRSARRRNLIGAVAVAPNRIASIAGKRVLLVDDVLTTGATADACARALRRAGAAGVDVVTVARAVLTQSG